MDAGNQEADSLKFLRQEITLASGSTLEQTDMNMGLGGQPFWEQQDEKAAGYSAENSYLNKILNDKLTVLGDGKVEIKKLQSDPTSPLYSCQTFEELNLKPELIKALYIMGFHQPSKIQWGQLKFGVVQEAALPLLLENPPQDIIAQSQSGTGKTATFLLAMLHRVDTMKPYPQCLCLAPTFELARQIGEVAAKMAQFIPGMKIRYATKGERVERGMTFTEQVLVGTPGKTLDWMTRFQVFDPKNIICFVLDEADVMIDQEGSYQEKCIRIHNQLINANPSCQCMLFSATYADKVLQFAEKLIADPIIITVRRQEQTLPYIHQYYVRCQDRNSKYRTILSLYSSLTVASSIIFCHTKASAGWLADKMRANGRETALLHGDMDVFDREKIAREFKLGMHKVLITTNLSSRGLDMPQVSLVVNYDPPVIYAPNPKDVQPDYDTYLHRIGRTGRFGKPGLAINLVESDGVMNFVNAFAQYFDRPIKELDAEDTDQLDAIEANAQQYL